MQQIKIFKSIESELVSLEQRINQWIAENDVEVVQIFGNLAAQSEPNEGEKLGNGYTPSDLFLVVVYEAERSQE